MADDPGPTPDVPPDVAPGWATEQPPAYGGDRGSWAAPGTPGEAFTAPPYGQQPPGPDGQPPGQQAYGQGYGQGYEQDAARQQYGGQPGYGPGPYGYRPPAQAPRPGIIPLRPLALGDILDGTIKLIRSNPRATLGLSAIVAAITTIPLAIGQAIYFRSMSGVLADPLSTSADEFPIGALAAQYIGQFISLIMTFVATTVLTGILTRVLGRAVFGGRITVGEAWGLTRSRMPALFGLVLLQGLILLLPLLVVGGLFAALAAGGALDGLIGSGSGSIDETVGAMVILLLLFLVIFIPYLLFFNTKFALAAPSIVLEQRGVIDAMRRSWRLVKGDSWRVFGILLLTGLLAGIISAVLTVPFSVGGSLLGLLGEGSTGTVVGAALLLAIGSVLSAMIAYPFQAGVNGLLYADRRMRAEAFDLVLQTAALQNQTQGWVHASVDDLWHPSNAAGTGPGAAPYDTPPYGAPPHGPQP